MPGWLLLLLAGSCLLDFQVDQVGQHHLEEGLQKIFLHLQKDIAEGTPAQETHWASKKFSVDPKDTFLSQFPHRAEPNFPGSAAPPQLPHRVKRGTGCEIREVEPFL